MVIAYDALCLVVNMSLCMSCMSPCMLAAVRAVQSSLLLAVSQTVSQNSVGRCSPDISGPSQVTLFSKYARGQTPADTGT